MFNLRTASSFSEFYILNGESLIRGSIRSQFLGSSVLVIESMLIFSLLLNSAYLDHDLSESFLQSISLHCLSPQNASRIVIAILLLTATTAIIFIALFAIFFHKSFKKLTIPGLSPFILNFNHIFLIPSVLLSIKGLRDDYLNGNFAWVFYANLSLTMLASLIAAIHSGRFYQYFDCDSLSKHGSIWDLLKYLSFSATIFLLEALDFKEYYSIWITVILSISLWDMLLHENIYYSLSTARLAVTLNLSNITQAIIVFIQINSNESLNISAIVPFLCTPILAYKVAERIIEAHTTRTMQRIDAYMIGGSNKQSSRLNYYNTDPSEQASLQQLISREEKAYLVDYFTRRCMESTEFVSKGQKVLLSLHKSILRFPNEQARDENTNHLGSLIEAEELIAVDSLKSQVQQLSDCLDRRIESNTSNSSHNHHSSNNPKGTSNKSNQSFDRNRTPSISSLFYLLEMEQNYPKLAIKLKEYMGISSEKRSLRDESLVWYLEHEMKVREKQERIDLQSTQSPDSVVKSIDLAMAFTFQEDLSKLYELIASQLNAKVVFLNEISQDCIHIDDMARNGTQLVEQNLKISNIIISLQARSKHCAELSFLNHAFLDCLWIDPRDTKYKLNWKRNATAFQKLKKRSKSLGQKPSQSQHNPSRSQLRKFKHESNNVIDFKKINLCECSVMVSLNEQRLGRVLKVSENSYEITGFAPSELIGQNCSIIQPSSIAANHNSMIRSGIDNGLLRYYNKGQSPLIMKRKDGSGVRVSLQFQIHTMGGVRVSTEIALIANICIQEQEFEKYFLVDIQQQCSKIEVASQHLFNRLLNKYFDLPSNLYGLNLGQIIPAIMKIGSFFEFHGDNKIKFQSLGFFPIASAERKRRRLHDFSQDLREIARKGYLKKSQNDIYLMELSATNYKRQGGYHTLFLKIKQFRKINEESELNLLLKNLLAPQLMNVQGISEEDQALIFDNILECNSAGSTDKQPPIDDTTAYFSERKSNNNNNNKLQFGIVATSQKKKQTLKHQITSEENSIYYNMQDNNPTAFNDSTQGQGNHNGEALLLDESFQENTTTRQQVLFTQQPLAQQHNISMQSLHQQYSQNLTSLVSLTSPRQFTTDFQSDQPELQKLTNNNQNKNLSSSTSSNQFNERKKTIPSPGTGTNSGGEKSEKNNPLGVGTTSLRKHQSQSDSIQHSEKQSNRKFSLSKISKRKIEDAFSTQKIQISNMKSQQLLMNRVPSVSEIPLQRMSTREREQFEFEQILFSERESNANLFYQQQESDNPNHENDSSNENAHHGSIPGGIADAIRRGGGTNHIKNNHHHNGDGGDSDKNENIKTDRGSASSQVSSQQSNSLKSALYRRMFNQSQSTMQISLIAYILVSFLSIFIIVVLMYLEMRSSLTQQAISFEYSWWSDQASYEITSILRYTKAKSLLGMLSLRPGFADDQKALLASIPSIIETSYFNFVDRLRVLSSQNYDDLFLVKQLYSLSSNYTQMIDVLNSRKIELSLLNFFQLSGYFCYQMAQSWYQQAKLAETELLNNFSTYSPLLTELSNSLADDQQNMADNMNSQVLRTLSIILSISFAISFILLPFYYVFQSRREFILRLFASIDPLSLKRMYENCVDQLSSIKSNRSKAQLGVLGQGRLLRRQSTHLSYPYSVKKKKNVPTTPLTKLSLRLVLQIFSIMILINVQPIVNVILISAQMSEAKTEYTVVRGLYSLQSAITTAEYSIFSHTTILAIASSSYIPASVVQGLFLQYNEMFKQLLLSFTSVVQQLQTNSRFDNTSMGIFISSLLTSDMCETLKNAKDSYFNKSDFDYSICVSLYSGINQKGFLQNLNKFQLIFQQYAEISMLGVLDERVGLMYQDFYTANTIPNLDNMFTVIKIASKAIVSCISEEKESYYSTINLTQFFLFLFEIMFLLILLPTVVFSFFQKIKSQMSDSIRMLAVLQIQQIYENSYISNFIRKNEKS